MTAKRGARTASLGKGTSRGTGAGKPRGDADTPIVAGATVPRQLSLPVIQGDTPAYVDGLTAGPDGMASALDTDPMWRDEVAAAIDTLAATRPDGFSVEDVRQAVGIEPPNWNAWGAAMAAARRRGVIVPAAVLPASRRARHGSLIRWWRRAPTAPAEAVT